MISKKSGWWEFDLFVGGLYLESLLDFEPADLFHEEEDSIAARSNVLFDFVQLHIGKVLQKTGEAEEAQRQTGSQ